jgi:hypothetical protein
MAPVNVIWLHRPAAPAPGLAPRITVAVSGGTGAVAMLALRAFMRN